MAYHSITFERYNSKGQLKQSINTWSTWGLIPSTPPIIQPAQPSFNYVAIPGSNKSLDLTCYLTGKPVRGDRTGSFTFYYAADSGSNSKKNTSASVVKRRKQLAEFLDGRFVLRMILEDDPDVYYVGRFVMKEWNSGANFSTVVIDYHVDSETYLSSEWNKNLSDFSAQNRDDEDLISGNVIYNPTY